MRSDDFRTKPCPRCGAAAGQPCVGKKGPRLANHVERRKASEKTAVDRKSTTGFVYFIGCAETGKVKIGFTRGSPLRRRDDLQTGAPGRLEVLAHAHATAADERQLHQRFEAYRSHGEWFALRGHLRTFIARLAATAAPDEAAPSLRFSS
jgi:hypothetical protein